MKDRDRDQKFEYVGGPGENEEKSWGRRRLDDVVLISMGFVLSGLGRLAGCSESWIKHAQYVLPSALPVMLGGDYIMHGKLNTNLKSRLETRASLYKYLIGALLPYSDRIYESAKQVMMLVS